MRAAGASVPQTSIAAKAGKINSKRRGTRDQRVVGSDALIAPVIASGNDAASSKRQEASGDASLQLPVTGARAKPPLFPRNADIGEGDRRRHGGRLMRK